MKKIIILLVFVYSYIVKAQNIVTMISNNSDFTNNNNYIKDTQGYLDKFVGTWKYQSSNEEFTLKIIKVYDIKYWNYSSDELFGGYKYVKDNIIKADNLNFTFFTDANNLPLPTDVAAFEHDSDMQGSGLSKNYNSVNLPGTDKVGQRHVYFNLEILPNTNETQIRFKINNRENIRLSPNDFSQGSGPGLPNNVILVKQ